MDNKWPALTLIGIAIAGVAAITAIGALRSPDERKLEAFQTCVRIVTQETDNKELAVESCKQVAGMTVPK